MPILDTLAGKASDKIAEGDWVDSAIKRGRDQVTRIAPEFKDPAEKMLDRMGQSKGAIGRLASDKFMASVTYIGLGRIDDAKLLYLREQATHKERQDAMRSAIGAAYDANKASEQAWDEFKAAVLDCLKIGGQVAIPLLLAMV